MKNLLLKENYDSHNLFEKINLLTEKQITAISIGLDWTVNNLPNAVLVGGTAVIHYISGSRDLTPDLDFMVYDINSVINKLSYKNINYKNLYVGYEYSLGITVDEFNTDFLNSDVGNTVLNKLILQTAQTAFIGNNNVRIINPELLAIMKFELGREKDINDGFALLSSGKCDLKKYITYANQLKNVLQDYEAIQGYKTLIGV